MLSFSSNCAKSSGSSFFPSVRICSEPFTKSVVDQARDNILLALSRRSSDIRKPFKVETVCLVGAQNAKQHADAHGKTSLQFVWDTRSSHYSQWNHLWRRWNLFPPNAIYVLMGKHIAWDTFLDEFLWDAKILELLPVIAFEPSQATNYIIILAKYIDIVWTISQQTWKMLT